MSTSSFNRLHVRIFLGGLGWTDAGVILFDPIRGVGGFSYDGAYIKNG